MGTLNRTHSLTQSLTHSSATVTDDVNNADMHTESTADVQDSDDDEDDGGETVMTRPARDAATAAADADNTQLKSASSVDSSTTAPQLLMTEEERQAHIVSHRPSPHTVLSITFTTQTHGDVLQVILDLPSHV